MSRKKEKFFATNVKRIINESHSKIREEEPYTIEIDSGSEKDNQNDFTTNIDKNDKNLKNNYYPRQNNINKAKILGK